MSLLADGTLALANVGRDYGHHDFGWYGGSFMFFCPLLFIGALFFLFFFVLPRGRRDGHGPWSGGSPFQSPEPVDQERGAYTSALETLADRFAKGEIDEDEFMRRRQALK